MTIDTLIFDLGVVIVDINDQRAIQFLQSHGIVNANKLFTRDNAYCVQYETGRIDNEQFLSEAIANAKTEQPITPEIIEQAWRNIIVGIPKWKIEILQRLAEQYTLIALSNNNALHTDEIDHLFKISGYSGYFFDLFHKSYLSHEVGMMKPGAEIFNHLINDANIEPKKALFLDDLQANLDAANKLGFKTALINSDISFDSSIKNLLL